MKFTRFKNTLCLTTTCLALGAFSTANAVNLNYEGLSFLEKPLATHIGDTTLELTGLLDAAAQFSDKADNDTNLSSSFQIGAETQLRNSWTIGATYLGEYVSNADDEYSDRAAVYLRNIWGTLSVGDVTGLVERVTGRDSRVGNADLAFDRPLAALEETGLTFIGRLGPSQYAVTVDEDSNYSLGLVFQRPIGNRDYRLSVNYRESELNTADGLAVFETDSIELFGELTYGSTIVDAALGYERLSLGAYDADRKYINLGASRKLGVLSLSAHAHFGDIEDQNERSYALGASYDIARGLSLNLGVNYSDAQTDLQGITIRNEDDTSGSISLTYRY